MDTRDVLVSFIVAAYNVEKYIEKCLRSIMEIKSKNIEILVVNDGSSDRTKAICESLAKEDERLKLVNRVNGGLSAARNTGIKESKGEWISFIDGDDWLVSQIEEKLLNSVDEKYDILYYGFRKTFTEDECKIVRNKSLKVLKEYDVQKIRKGILDIDSCLYKEYLDDYVSPHCAPAKLYKRSLLINNNFFFDEEVKWAEDILFNFKVLGSVKKALWLPDIIYNYRMQADSITHSYRSGKSKDVLTTVDKVYNCINNNDEYLYYFWVFAIRQFLYALKLDFCHTKNPKSFRLRKKEIMEFKNREYFKKGFEKGNFNELRRNVRIPAMMVKYNFFYLIDRLFFYKEKIELIKMREKIKK